MPTIAQCLRAIRQAVYGRDVREAIAEGIEKCYSDVSNDITLAHNAAQAAAQESTQLAQDSINSAIADAGLAIQAANAAASEALTKANAANTAAESAQTQAMAAYTAAAEAQDAKADALSAAQNANTQAQNAQAAAASVAQENNTLLELIQDTEAAKNAAILETANANHAVLLANTAAQNADAAVDDANAATARAQTATQQVEDIRSRLVANIIKDGETFYGVNDYGERITDIITGVGSGSGGGSGGGDVVVNTKVSLTDLTIPSGGVIRYGGNCVVQFSWSSLLDDEPTGNGTVKVYVKGGLKLTRTQVGQGPVSIDIGEYLSSGTNTVRVMITDIYGKSTYRQFDIEAVDLELTSSFDTSTTYIGAILFRCTPSAAVNKTLYFKLDGTVIGTMETRSHREVSYSIPSQSHGAHSLEVWYSATIGGDTLESNHLYFEFISLSPGNSTPIIASDFSQSSAYQYDTILIPFKIYDPDNMTATAEIYENGTLKLTGVYDRSPHEYAFNANASGAQTVKIKVGAVEKTFSISVTERQMDISPETDGLELYLSAIGRSNAEQNPAVWTYNSISATFAGMDWKTNGWMTDENSDAMLRISGGATVTIPFQIFANDFRASGKTISFEFAIRSVQDFDAVAISCMNGGRGIQFTPVMASFASEGAGLSTQYKDDEHIRLDISVEKRSDNRLITAYINGKPSAVTQYPANDDFSQVSPVGITIGNSACWVDIYCIRVYDHSLTEYQILDNFIADTQNGAMKVQRYTRNDIYDQYGNIQIDKLPPNLPYMIIEMEELPQYKGDKKPAAIEYVEPLNPARCFTATGVQANVQGTSSAKYPVKNLDLQFKNGFEMAGGHADNFQLSSTVKPFNRFVLKADVASSEGANNVELVMLYCDFDPYKRPEELADSQVRKGIYGFPIVCFQRIPSSGVVKFIGKYNFNFPKRAPAPYGYSGDMESWEFENNTSELMLFLSDVFDETLVQNPDSGEMVPKWTLDFEARFPSDEWRDYSKIRELVSFVVSTNRDTATNNALSESVTYEGVEYTTDSSAYRLAKFRNEFPTYAEKNSFLFYYLFTEQFLMVDSRAKNLFIGFSGGEVTESERIADRKAIAEPYDMDTAIGTNNEGSLVFDSSLEDTDHLAGGANVYNGQASVLWNNVRDAYPTELAQMYKNLRSAGFSYTEVERRFEAHQEKWPEAIWIEDHKIKYTDPLLHPAPGKEATSEYLPMAQGSKEMQRKRWLYYRFKNRDSKWNAGEALSEVIQLRAYATADISVTPYTDIYPTVIWASTYMTQERGTHNVASTFHCPVSSLNDTEVYVHSASQIKSLGDLSPLQVGFADFSAAVNLQEIKIGDNDANYENTRLNHFTVGTNRMLKKVDARNCTALGTGEQKTVDLSNCPLLEEAYFDGTSILGASFMNGGNLNTLHLPSTITSLILLNQPRLTGLVANASNLTTLWVENCPADTKALLMSTPANARVRLINIAWEATDVAAVTAILNKLDMMTGLDENGDNVSKAQISGTIHVPSVSGEDLEAFATHGYTYLNFTYDHVSATLTYKTFDGSSTIATETVIDGGNGTRTNNTSRASTAQYTYTPNGWSLTANGSANANALTAVTSNRTVYAAYTATIRSYTITFAKKSEDGGGTLQSRSYNYGATPSYTGSTPTTTKGSASDYPFDGWEPAIATVTGAKTYYAKFRAPVTKVVEEITDSWDTLFASLDDGTYATKYMVGNYKTIDLGTEGSGNVSIVAIDADEAAGGGTAELSMVCTFCLNTTRSMNPRPTGNTEGTGTFGGWDKTQMKAYLLNTIWPKIPQNIRDRIIPVKKYTRIYRASDEMVVNNVETTETVYLLSGKEVFGSDSKYETLGQDYTGFFSDNESRKMYLNGTASTWWLRSASSEYNFYHVESFGGWSAEYTWKSKAVVIGFCLGSYTKVHAKAGGLSAL